MAKARKTELEAKFVVPDQSVFEQLLTLTGLAGLAVGEQVVEQVTDRYLDSPDWGLLAGAFACRLRENEGGALMALKSLGWGSGLISRRDEYEFPLELPLDYLQPENWPAGPMKDLVMDVLRGRRLRQVLVVQQGRHKSILLDGGRPVAELSLDQVRFQDGRLTWELEAELLPEGAEVELERIALDLAMKWHLVSASSSKFERGLHLLEKRERPPAWIHLPSMQGKRYPEALGKYPDVRPQNSMSEAGLKTLGLHFEHMLAHEPGTRLGDDIEELHDMRVATRRMRAAFRVFGPYFDARLIRPHIRGLKRTGRALGPVRDLDVFEERARQYLATLPVQDASQSHSAEKAGPLDSLLLFLQQERVDARERLLAFLNSPRYLRFVEQFGRFVSAGPGEAVPVLKESFSDQVRHVAPRLIYDRYEAVRAYEPLLDSASIELLHALRIDFKRLRYALEFFVPVLGKEIQDVVSEVKGIQDHLGDLNDADVAIRLLDHFLAGDPPGRAGLLAFKQNRIAERDRLLDSFAVTWEHFKRPVVHRSLALAVSAL